MIRHRSIIVAALPLALAGLLLSPLAAQDTDAPDVQTTKEAQRQARGEARLAKLLEGRVAGEPVRCVRTFPNQRIQTIAGTAYVYGSGQTIYVQRTQNPEQIDTNDVIVSLQFQAGQLCRLDQTTTVDRFNGFFTGVVLFEDFIPYSRAPSES